MNQLKPFIRDQLEPLIQYFASTTIVRYVADHPFLGLAVATVLLGIYHLLNRKSQLQRDADERLKQLRKERGDYYRTLRPPR